jgi:hypothetical protein
VQRDRATDTGEEGAAGDEGGANEGVPKKEERLKFRGWWASWTESSENHSSTISEGQSGRAARRIAIRTRNEARSPISRKEPAAWWAGACKTKRIRMAFEMTDEERRDWSSGTMVETLPSRDASRSRSPAESRRLAESGASKLHVGGYSSSSSKAKKSK